jgi:hypothetical protein
LHVINAFWFLKKKERLFNEIQIVPFENIQ